MCRLDTSSRRGDLVEKGSPPWLATHLLVKMFSDLWVCDVLSEYLEITPSSYGQLEFGYVNDRDLI